MKTVLEALSILVATIFIVAWSYGKSYYDFFGVPLGELKIPTTSYLVAVWGLLNESLWIFAIHTLKVLIVVGLLILLGWLFNKNLPGIETIVNSTILVITFITVIFFFTGLARDLGEEHAKRDNNGTTSRLPRIKIVLKYKDLSDYERANLSRTNLADGEYLLLSRQSATYFLIPYGNAAKPLVYRVPDNRVIVSYTSPK